ncbi:hypothetical protein [Rhizobium sp. Leaf262]|uniref:hypothetical protein n=1 Tax=Rhizobium sp. Leaf262 TaxID=1736312 RepID=UPI000715CC0D|nr:hypothetical protein [Rhizobium sp. Leaf262]KQO79435.1 hypothetical protein ASF29_23275 [Rhizobium sp. Leaf262]
MAFDFRELLREALAGRGGLAPIPQPRPDQIDPAATASIAPSALPVEAAEEAATNDRFFSSLFKGNDERQGSVANALIQGGAAMMVAGGPSVGKPTNFMSVLGSGIGTGAQAYNDFGSDQADIALKKAQVGAANAKLAASQKGQLLAATFGNLPKNADGSVDFRGLSPEQLYEYFKYQVSTGDEAGARDTLGMIQKLQQTAAGNGMIIGEDGNMLLAPGYGESLRSTEEFKSGGRKAGEAPYNTTSDLTELDRINAERVAAGQPKLTTEEWLKQTQTRKSTQVNVGGNSNKFKDKLDEKAADRFNTISEEGNNANQMVGDMQMLIDLGKKVGTGKGAELMVQFGPWADMFGIKLDGLSEAQAFDSIVNRITPQMRPAGSGAASDLDVRMFMSAIPNIGRTAEGNEIIAMTMQNVSKNKIAAAEIATRVSKGELTWEDGDREIRALPNPYEQFKDFQKNKKKGPTIGGTAFKDEPAQEVPQVPPNEPVTVNNASDYAKLPSGSIVIWNGRKLRKP